MYESTQIITGMRFWLWISSGFRGCVSQGPVAGSHPPVAQALAVTGAGHRWVCSPAYGQDKCDLLSSSPRISGSVLCLLPQVYGCFI